MLGVLFWNLSLHICTYVLVFLIMMRRPILSAIVEILVVFWDDPWLQKSPGQASLEPKI